MIVDFNFAEVGVTFQMDLDETVHSDAAIIWYLQQGLAPEPEVFCTMCKMIRPGMTVVDGGANVGFFTLLMSRLVGETGTVLAFEPDKRNLAKLRHNLSINDIRNCRVFEEALYSYGGVLYFNEVEDNGESHISNNKESAVPVRTMALNELHPMNINFIKLDIEGSEFDALMGAEKILAYKPNVIVEFNSEHLAGRKVTEAQIRAKLRVFGNLKAFKMSNVGDIPALIPDSCALSFDHLNANVLFSTVESVAKAWPEVHI